MNNLNYYLEKNYKLNPNKILYRFHDDKGDILEIKTYKEIYQDAKKIGLNLLNKYKIKPGSRILICFPPGINYIKAIWGCLISGIVPVPIYPPNPKKFKNDIINLNLIIKNCEIKFILTEKTLKNAYFIYRIINFRIFPKLKWICINKMNNTKNTFLPQIESNSIAFIQYTSGSTSNPKGVVLTHQNVIENLKSIFNCKNENEMIEKTKNSVLISWLPPYHDMGLIGYLLFPVLMNSECNFCSPFSFIKNPKIWFQLITKYKGTFTSSPNFGFTLCNRKIKDKSDFDLSSLKIIMNAAEKIIPETINKFYDNFKSIGLKKEVICPSYGIAENTIAVSMWGNKTINLCKNNLKKGIVLEKEGICIQNIQLQSSGKACLGVNIEIVDYETKERKDDSEIGEIWVNSKSKSIKYWNKPDLTEKVLLAKIKNDTSSLEYLRTGDLGFINDGYLYFVSRIKNIINIRGKNYYPEDICDVISKIKELRPGCQSCFCIEEEQEEKVVLITEVRKGVKNYNDLNSIILESITKNFSLKLNEILLIEEKNISKTTSGKIQHYKNKERFLKNDFNIKFSWKNENVAIKSEIDINSDFSTKKDYSIKLREILKKNFFIPTEKIKDSDIISSYGVDSMQYITLVQMIENILGIDSDCLMIKDITFKQFIDISWNEYKNLEKKSIWKESLPKHYYKMLEIEKTFKESIPNLDFDNETHILKYNKVEKNCVYFNTQKGDFITCASNAYTSLSGHPRIRAAAKNAIDTFGTGIFGPRVVVGASKLLWELEQEFSDFLKTESTVIFSTAYLAMITVLSCLTQFGINYIFYDELSHMCILDALKGLGQNVKIFKYKHNDVKDLEKLVLKHVKIQDRSKFKLVIADSLFGMDGDLFDLPNFHPVCKKYGLTILLDEAHSLGSVGKTGRGIEEHFQMFNTVDIKLGGMNKGLPLLGGWVSSNKEICKLLRFRSHGTMFTGTMPPPLLATALESIRVLKEEPEHLERLDFNKKYLIKGLQEKGFKLSEKVGMTPIIVIIIPNDQQLLSMYYETQKKKLQIFISIFPAVPKNQGRIRISAVSGYTKEIMDKIIEILYLSAVESGYFKK